jgi:hypothetical protein
VDEKWVSTDAVTRAVYRARMAVGELNTSRRSEDIERARKGVEFELERALRLLGHPWTGPQTPGPRAGAKGVIVAMDEELPFEDPYKDWTPKQCRALYETTPPPVAETVTTRTWDGRVISQVPIPERPPCGKDDKHCGLRGGSAHCGGCRD